MGWLGTSEHSLEHAKNLETIEMGARQYDARIGRFLQVDPVEGGSLNDHEYAGRDPVNNFDLAETICWSCGTRWLRAARDVGLLASAVGQTWAMARGASCRTDGTRNITVCSGASDVCSREGTTIRSVISGGAHNNFEPRAGLHDGCCRYRNGC